MVRFRPARDVRPALLALAFTLAPAFSAPAAEAETRRVTLAWPSDVGPLHPHGYAPNQMFAQAMVYEPLVSYQAGGGFAPCLAESWEISPDGRVYLFRLRKGVTFANGEPFDAAAVVANINAILADRPRHAWLGLARRLRAVEAVDPHTVRLTLSAPYQPTLHELSLPRPFRFIAPSQLSAPPGQFAPAGTGPWTLHETRPGEWAVFRRNPAYRGPAPAFDEAQVRIIPDANARAIAFETGEIDVIHGPSGLVSPDMFRRLAALPGVKARLSAPAVTLMFALNSGRGPTADRAVRRALGHAVDRDAIVASVLQGAGVRADALFAPAMSCAEVDLEPYRHDPQLARRLLDEAGWTLAPGARVRSRDGQPLQLDLAFTGDDPLEKMLAEIVQASLADIGVAARLVGEDRGAAEARQREGRFGMAFHRTWGAPYDPYAFMSAMCAPAHADYQAQSGLPDKAEIDAAITALLAAGDAAERETLCRRVLTRLHEEAIYLPLVHVADMSLAGPGVADAPFSPTAGEIPVRHFRPETR